MLSRDGLPVHAAGKLDLHRETFSAMTATLMGAAEIALSQIEGGRMQSVVVATPRTKMVLVGVGRDLILVAYVSGEQPTEDLLARLSQAGAAVASVLSGE